MEVKQRNKYPQWAEEQRRKADELARVRAVREKKMDRNKKEVRHCDMMTSLHHYIITSLQ